MLGYFNAIRNFNEKSKGTTTVEAHSDNLNHCCKDTHLKDLRYMRSSNTWSNNNERKRIIECKLDRVLINEKCEDSFLRSLVVFKSKGLSDHFPNVVE